MFEGKLLKIGIRRLFMSLYNKEFYFNDITKRNPHFSLMI